MEFAGFASEIMDFLSTETLRAIDYGVLDLHHIKDIELREAFCFLEELLTAELQMNYFDNSTGIFRVNTNGRFWYYKQGKHVIRADSLVELERQVNCENRIWYVFDENLAKRLGR